MFFCTKCGNPIADDAVFCNRCGEQIVLEKPVLPSAKKKRSFFLNKSGLLTTAIAALLALCIGFGIGAAVFGSGSSRELPEGVELSGKQEKYITSAIDQLRITWKKLAVDMNNQGLNFKNDGHVEIIDTRLVTIKPNDDRDFDDIEAIVSFELLSDCYGTHPYYMNAGANSTVIFRTDGSVEVFPTDYFRSIIVKTYDSDFSDVIDEVFPLGSAYNEVLN